MSKVRTNLMKSAAFRRRMRSVNAQAEWRAVLAKREREIAAFEAMPFALPPTDAGANP